MEDENSTVTVYSIPMTNATIKEHILTGRFNLVTQASTAKKWQIYGKIEHNGVELKQKVACRNCFAVLKFDGKNGSTLVKHKCYIEMNKIREKAKDIRQKLVKKAATINRKVEKKSLENNSVINKRRRIKKITREIALKLKSGEYFISDRQSRSKAWNKFSRIMNENLVELRDYVICKKCEKIKKINNFTTSNLIKHKCSPVAHPTEEKIVTEATINPPENLTSLVTKWILNDCQSYELIQSESFNVVCQNVSWLGSIFGGDTDVTKFLPSLLDIEKSLSAMFHQCFQRIKSEIATIKENGFGLTSDVWTDNLTKQSYIVLTIHYVKNAVVTFRFLGLRKLEGEMKTNKDIVEKVKQILESFDCKLSNKTIIVTDGINDAFLALSDTQNLPCMSQLLNSALKESIEAVPEILEILNACKNLIKILLKIDDLNCVLRDSFEISNPNNFISISKMLSSVGNNWSEIEEILQNKNQEEQILTLNVLHLWAVIKTFQQFEEAIETLEEDQHLTLHVVIPYLTQLIKSCSTDDNEFQEFDFMAKLKKTIRFQLDKIATDNITYIHKLALFLYPPTKQLLQFSDKEKRCIEDECIRLMKFFNNELQPVLPSSSICKRIKLLSDFMEPEINTNSDELITREVQYYKDLHILNSEDFDVFEWWELQKYNFPFLHKLSCMVLTTPATCAASRRIFSVARRLLCERSAQLSEEIEIEKIMFMNSNGEDDELDGCTSDNKI